jgi:TonB family protein
MMLINLSKILVIAGIILLSASILYCIYFAFKMYINLPTTQTKENRDKGALFISISIISHFIIVIIFSWLWSRIDTKNLEIPREKFSLDGESYVDVQLYNEETTPPEDKPIEPEPISEPIKDEQLVSKDIMTPPTFSVAEPKTNTPPSTPSTNTNNTTTSSTTSSSTGVQGDGEEKPFQIAEDMPLFPGCEDAGGPLEKEACTKRKMTEFIQQNLKYPDQAIKNNTQGIVRVTFIVEKDGIISDIRLLNNIGDGTDVAADNAIKAMNNMTRKIAAGKQKGRPVRVRYTIPINFALTKRQAGPTR